MAEAAVICRCEEITAEVIQCPEHFHLFKAGRRLKSVGSIIRESFPMDPNIPAEVLENARIRGQEVDRLFCEYINTGRLFVPKGTMREDSKGLLMKLIRWYDKQNFSEVRTQVPLGDTDHGGVVDLILDGVPVDLKCTYEISETARLQVAGYSALYDHTKLYRGLTQTLADYTIGKILHVSERFSEPKWVQVNQADMDDWRILLSHWRMLQRRTP